FLVGTPVACADGRAFIQNAAAATTATSSAILSDFTISGLLTKRSAGPLVWTGAQELRIRNSEFGVTAFQIQNSKFHIAVTQRRCSSWRALRRTPGRPSASPPWCRA